MAGGAFAVEGDGVRFATESYAASALYTTLASLSGALWRIRRARTPTEFSTAANRGTAWAAALRPEQWWRRCSRGMPPASGSENTGKTRFWLQSANHWPP